MVAAAKTSKSKSLLVTIFFILIFTFISSRPVVDNDFGWHYKYGEYIFHTKHLLKQNIYSYTYTDYRWANSYWLSQLILYSLFEFLGPIGLNVILGSIFFTVLDKSVLRYQPFAVKGSVFLIVTLMLSSYSVLVRPMYFSTLFLLIELHILINKRDKINFLPLVFLLWANMHADFTLGLTILGFYTLERLYEKIKEEIKTPKNTFKNIIHVCTPLILCVFVTFINPYTYELWLTLLNELVSPMKFSITEFKAIQFSAHEKFQPISYLYLGTFLLFLGISIFTQFKKMDKWFIATAVLFLLMSFKMRYFYRILTLLAVFGIVTIINTAIAKLNKSDNLKIQINILNGIKIFSPIILFLLIITAGDFIYNTNNTDVELEKAGFPIKSVEYLNTNNPDGNMFNNYGWGGYLIWKLPQYKTFIDGRMATWHIREGTKNNYALTDYYKISLEPYQKEDFLTHIFNENDIAVAVIRPNTPLNDYLLDHGWEAKIRTDKEVLLQRVLLD